MTPEIAKAGHQKRAEASAPPVSGPVQQRPQEESSNRPGIASDPENLPETRDRPDRGRLEPANEAVDVLKRHSFRGPDLAPEHHLLTLKLPLDQDDACTFRVRRWCSGDRKSTRLNSSHLGISYAVF